MEATINKKTIRILISVKSFFLRNKLILFFFVTHVVFAIFLGRLFAFAPDEERYLSSFNKVYTLPVNIDAQTESGWITAPTLFLWVVYLPAKLLNLGGMPDYLSIRFLSIAITTLSLFLLLRIKQNVKENRVIPQELIFFSFFIPSVFLWTSTGLREAFIITEITLFLVGLNYLLSKKNTKGILLLFIGSYGLLSTKWYLWLLLTIAVIVFFLVNLILKSQKEYWIKLTAAAFIAPLILYAGTTSQNPLNFIFNGSITEAGFRCGVSEAQIEKVTLQGDYTLISLHFHMLENSDSILTKVFRTFNLDDKVESLWNEKLQAAMTIEGKESCKNAYVLNGDLLKPGSITEPWTMLWPAFVFLAGPFPFLGEPSVATAVSSFESPLWWLLYLLVIYQFYRFRKSKLFRDPAILFTLIFLAGQIALSSLIEINLGTSFRHRSILLAPLVFLYLRITQRVNELRDVESKPIL